MLDKPSLSLLAEAINRNLHLIDRQAKIVDNLVRVVNEGFASILSILEELAERVEKLEQRLDEDDN